MKRTTMYIVLALAAALAMGLMAGCSSQPASSSSAGDSASAATEQTQEQVIAELKDALANVPEYKSVTITEDDEATAVEDSEPIKGTTVYKYDASSDKLKTSMEGTVGDITIAYYTDGDDVVCVTDAGNYAGTTEQFDRSWFTSADALVKDAIGDFDALIDCAATVEKMDAQGLTAYTLTLDPEKYMASDEILTSLAEVGDPVKESLVTFTFNEDGSIGAIDKKDTYEKSTDLTTLVFSDYDSTTVDPLPEATKTYEDMEAEMMAKLDAMDDELTTVEAESK